jgi:putative ABC transport system substrate-binding protein
VKSLAHPATNVTGVTAQVRDVAPKWVPLLLDVAPGIRRVAVLTNPAQAEHAMYINVMQNTLPAGIQLQIVEAGDPRQYEGAFATMNQAHAEALVILGNAIFTQDSTRLATLALSHRLPSIYLFRAFPDAGGLMSYGPDHHEIFDLASAYVDKILRGAKPGVLPVQQPTKFQLIVNEKTARALGLRFPQSIVARASEVIR